MQPERKYSLPAIEELLASGGDARIMHNAQGMNKYGCFSVPQPDILSYSSCTASTISQAGFAAAEQLYRRLEHASHKETAAVTYAREMNRIRKELLALCSLTNVDIIFGTSGTDLHLFAAQLLRKENDSLLVIMPDASETGSGVPAALHGRHFSTCTAFGDKVVQGKAIDDANGIEVATLKSRLENGALRLADLVDVEAKALAMSAVAEGQRVLVVLTDISKTGLTIPSPACALALKRQFPDMVDVLVDACQFRLSNATLRAYLEQDFLLALTGSKFVTGPAFSAALLVPQTMARRLRNRTLPPALNLYSAQADWPLTWSAHSTLPDTANYGLLLRWEAALAELRAFHALSKTSIGVFLESFAAAVQKRLEDDPVFEPLVIGEIDRQPIAGRTTWDHIPTIFPFMLRHSKLGALLNKGEMTKIYERMRIERCYVGQPVACGALRLCLDMRLIVDALSSQGRGGDAVIADAMRVLDKAAMLVGQLAATA